jgi:hypothetical protein
MKKEEEQFSSEEEFSWVLIILLFLVAIGVCFCSVRVQCLGESPGTQVVIGGNSFRCI